MGSSDQDNTMDCMMDADPQQQHRWLLELVGQWTFQVQVPAQDGQDPQTLTGTETVESLGDLWIVAQGQGAMPNGKQAHTMMTLGYDPTQQRFVGTWVGSMMTHMWIYDGQLDDGQRILTLNSQGPAVDAKGQPLDKPGNFRDIIEIISPNQRTLTGQMQDEKGNWQQLMTATYTRRQPR